MKHVCALTLLLGLVGCQFKGEPAAPPVAAMSEEGGYWLPRPTAVRVYPTTRFVRQGEVAVLEARVELFDDMGDSVKGAGEFRLELHDATRTDGEGLLYTWQVTLRTIEDQREHYDPVTRAYLFRLKLDDIAVAKRSTLLAVAYTAPTGRRYTAEALIKTDW